MTSARRREAHKVIAAERDAWFRRTHKCSRAAYYKRRRLGMEHDAAIEDAQRAARKFRRPREDSPSGARLYAEQDRARAEIHRLMRARR